MRTFVEAVFASALLLGPSAALSLSVSPIEKVITLLEDLKFETEQEGENEAITYDAFACFCKKNSDDLSDHIKQVEGWINTDSAKIADDTATKNDKASEVNRRKAKVEELAKELQSTIAECDSEKTKYEAVRADLEKAISSLHAAIDSMEGAKPSAAALVSIRQSIGKSLALADALDLITRPKQQAVSAFLQQHNGVDPEDPEYKHHSQKIIDLLNKLLDDFNKEAEDTTTEWTKTENGCTDTQAALNQEITENKDAIAALVRDIDSLEIAIGETRKYLIDGQADLGDDKLYMKDLTKRCEERAQDWDQRTQMRGKEVTALTEALNILKNQVQGLSDEVNERALLLQQKKPSSQEAPKPAKPAAAKTPVTKEQGSKTAPAQAVASKSISFLQRSTGMSNQVRQEKALAMLRKEGQRLSSPVLSQLAARAAADPFLKVKDLIQKLVERLIREATQEATKKGFCDTELAKAEKDREYRYTEVQKLNVELEALEYDRDALELEMHDLREAIDGQTSTLETATEMRSDEKKENEETLEKAQRGAKALNEAILILKSFYSQAAKASAFLDVSPIDEGGVATPGFEGASKGKQAGSKAILGLLEVMKTDFERTIKNTAAAEKRAQADFVEMDRDLRADTAGKETKEELDKQDHTKTLASIEAKTQDMQTNMDLVDKANAELEELRPVCIDTGMSYEERVQKREEEINALHGALCTLDTDGVEADCTKQAA